MATMNQRWVLKRRPEHEATSDDLELVDVPIPALQDGEVLIRNLFLSLDPSNRIWMSDRDQYMPPVQMGAMMRGLTLGVVEQSRSERFSEGEMVMPGDGGWELYTVANPRYTRKAATLPGVPLTANLSVLGPPGLTAYFGLLDVAAPKPGETLVVSAAAGAVGSIVGQIGKIKGCRVIGIAGGAAKCRWITDDLGFDAAIDYKSENVGEALDRLCPDGVDIDFENVGGEIMDAVFSRLRLNGRMSLCGLISTYNDEAAQAGPRNFGRILMKRLTVRGFIVLDYLTRSKEARADLEAWIAEGRIKWKDHVVEEGLAAAPGALQRLFTGNHDGKLILRISA